MDRKKFTLIAIVITVAAVLSWVVEWYTPDAGTMADWTGLPREVGDWRGVEETLSEGTIALLEPDGLVSIDYVGSEGIEVNLFVASWSGEGRGPHSPLNCLPASGWNVGEATPRELSYGDKTIPARRLKLEFRSRPYVMDFWYITPYGETSSDYRLKLFEMLTSLTLQPRYLTFVRFVAADSEEGLAALDKFAADFIPEIYSLLPQEMR
jgi:EpsI family protein